MLRIILQGANVLHVFINYLGEEVSRVCLKNILENIQSCFLNQIDLCLHFSVTVAGCIALANQLSLSDF